ncbi:MAG: hypothetical protein GC191_00875 [Azospirillum sp.]|nr:hypothetical protein [Azospirillum sp.]
MKPTHMRHGEHHRDCCCPVCRGLTPFTHPVFGSGQVLTAADLTALLDYAKAKNRLHNRYLHGWGVVAGLEVACDDCEGVVSIAPGYAIDPCGNDIVVAEATSFNVIKAIKACGNAGRARRGQCDPYQPPADPNCQQLESHWCLSLSYTEIEGAYVRALTAASVPADCGCGCGGKGSGGCGCGGKGSAVAAPTTQTTVSSTPSAGQSCVPRRRLECFEIGLMESKQGCAPPLELTRPRHEPGTLGGVKEPALAELVPADSLLGRIVACVAAMSQRHDQSLSQADQSLLADLLAGQGPGQYSKTAIYTAVWHYKQAVDGLLRAEAETVRCQLAPAAAALTLAPPDPVSPPDVYWNAARDTALGLLAVELQLLLDCLCRAFLPPLPPDPCDDRVAIACITVRNDRIIDICNFSCRHYAGAFPSAFYWLSAIPLVPVISQYLSLACCQPDLLTRNSPLVNNLLPILDGIDPTGTLRVQFAANNFALPRSYLSALQELPASTLLQLVFGGFLATLEAARQGEPPPDYASLKAELATLRQELEALKSGKL